MTSRTFILNLNFALTADDQDRVLRDAALVVQDDRVSAIGPTEKVLATHPLNSRDERIDGRRLGAIPGLIDCHVHLSETLSRAVFPDNLATHAWVLHWAKPFYAHLSESDERISVLLGAAEMLRCGTTCFLDMGAQHDPGITCRAVAEMGIRGITGRHAADVKPAEIPPSWSERMVEHHFFPNHEVALEVLEQCVRDWDGYAKGRIGCWVNIEGKEPCSLELHVGARELAEALGVGTTYHIASSIEEAELAERRYGCGPITRIERAGGLGANLVLAHATATADSEVPLLAKHGTSVTFCPGTSLKLAKGATAIGKYPEMRQAGIDVGLGTDGVSAAGSMNLLRQMYLAAGIFKDARMNPDALTARDAFRMATIEGARALGCDTEIGSIEPGKKADFVLFDLDHHEWTPFHDPLQAVVFSVTPASISETWVDGRCLYRHGRVLRVDEAQLREEARRRAVEIVERAGLRRDVPVTTTLNH